MKTKTVLKDTLHLYKKNFLQLMLALLVELVLRGIALSPVLFLADKALAPLALLAVPLYILIVLPARQNYALALQDMMDGGSVLSVQLISVKDYGKKLWRGVKGMLCILLWSALAIVGAVLLYRAFMGLVDVLTLMRIFSAIGGNWATGMLLVLGAEAFFLLLTVLGCAVHSGARHAAALGDKRLMKGQRLRLTALWFIGLVLIVPFAVVVLMTCGNYVKTIISTFLEAKKLSMTLTNGQIGTLIGGTILLLCPVLPLKNMLPAVFLRKVKESRHDAA